MKRRDFFVALLIALLLSACGSKESSGCPLPPKGFSESDLVGTWHAIDSLKDSILIIREDGRYKQTMYVKRTGFEYESDWQPWRITYSDKGLPYLHLEGLLMCAYWYGMECTQKVVPTVGVGDTRDPFGDAAYWYDGCQKKWVDTPGEGVFKVFGVPPRFDQPPRGIHLVPFTKSTDTSTGPWYELREP
jgi:hypothetical protein